MVQGYWKKINKELKKIIKPGEELICVKIFTKKNSICELCGYHPLKWNFVLFNPNRGKTLRVGSNCIVNIKKILDKHDKDFKIAFIERYNKVAKNFNNDVKGVAKIIKFDLNPKRIERILSNPSNIDYVLLKSILDYTVNFEFGKEYHLFHKALDIYLDRQYYLYDSVDTKPDVKNVDNYIKEIREEILEEHENEILYDGIAVFDDCLQEDWSDHFDDYDSEYWESDY